MRVERRDGTGERSVLIGMVVSRAVLGAIAAKWESNLFASRWANLVGGWAVEHYNKYRRAPGRGIENYFDRWAESGTDRDTVRLVESFLGSLSAEHERLKRTTSPDHLLDVAGRLFNRVRLSQLRDELEADLETGDVERAVERQAAFRRVELGLGAGVTVLAERAMIDAAFESAAEPLVTYPGALGNFFAGALCRDAFISFMGKEKIGKCLIEGTEILMADGRLVDIAELVRTRDSTPVVTLNEDTLRFETAVATGFWDNGERECGELRTRTGKQITATLTHPFLTPDGWKRFEELRPGDFIAVAKRVDFFGTTSMPESEIKVLAYLLAEGCTGHGSPSFTNTDDILVEDFECACDALGIGHRRVGVTTYLIGGRPFSRRMGLYGHGAKTKQIPSCVFSCPREQVALFLSVFFSCDGHISRGSDYIELTLANKRMLRQISHLLSRFGIVHDLLYHPVRREGRVFRAWRLAIRSQFYVDMFLREINFLSVKRRMPAGVKTNKSFLDKIPWQIAARMYEGIKQEMGAGPRSASCSSTRGVFYATIGKARAQTIRCSIERHLPIMGLSFAPVAHTKTASRVLGSDILWDEVRAVRAVGSRRVYDLTIPSTHNFVANDVVSHNSFWLQDMAVRAVEQGRRVAYFEVGDNSQPQVMRRLAVRVAGRPLKPGRHDVPVSIETPEAKQLPAVERRRTEYDGELDADAAWDAFRELGRRAAPDALKLSCHPNSSINVAGIESVLEGWERDGWSPDVILIDYADILAPPDGRLETRDQINAGWKAMRALSQRLHCLVVTATQTDADSYAARTLRRDNFSEDKRKYAHVTGMVGINQTEPEKSEGLYRLNWVLLRELEFSESKCVWAAGCLALGNPCLASVF